MLPTRTGRQALARSFVSESQSLIRTLIIENEPHMRQYLRDLLGVEKGIAVVGEATSGPEGLDQIHRLSPHLVFLGVQTPKIDGFGVIATVGAKKMPAFIFVAACSDYAIRAFEVGAIDYLCLPFNRDRLATSLQRAARYLMTLKNNVAVDSHTTADQSGDQWLSRVAITENGEVIFVPIEEIGWISAADKYVAIHTKDRSHIVRQTIQALEGRLDPKQFVRIHRSILVRKTAVRSLHRLFHGDYMVKLNGGEELKLSRNFREAFFEKMSR